MSRALRSMNPKIYTLLMVTIGCIFFSFGINAFVIPHNLLSGGISGVALMVYYLTQIPVGTLNLILNLPVLYATYRWLGGWHLIVTIYGTAVVSFLIDVFSFAAAYKWTHDPIVGAIMGGIFCGTGMGIIYRSGGNSGGLDPIALIIRKYWGLQMGSIVFAINCLILFVAAIIINVESAAITLINLYISAMITNKIIVGFSQRKAVFIISYTPDGICNIVTRQLGRGATILHGEGAYTRQDKKVVLAVVGLMQIAKLKAAVQKVDPHAFLLITDTSEVIGQGFTYHTPLPSAAVAEKLQNAQKRQQPEGKTKEPTDATSSTTFTSTLDEKNTVVKKLEDKSKQE